MIARRFRFVPVRERRGGIFRREEHCGRPVMRRHHRRHRFGC